MAENKPQLNSRTRVALTIAAAGMTTAGETMRGLDDDNEGGEDVAGTLLSVGGKAINRLMRGDERGYKRYLKEVRDAISEYLEEEEG